MLRAVLVRFRRHGAKNMAAALLVVNAVSPALAADASMWDTGSHSAMRLIAAQSPAHPERSEFRAGVELKLASGWKTYWRYPGDSGVPPRFGFARSENVAEVLVKWPAPHRFSDAGEVTIGYKGNVIFPLSVTPKDPRLPAVLRLDLEYALCEKLCVPASGKAELTLSAPSSDLDAELTNAETRVPQAARIGDPGPLAIRSVRNETGHGEPRVIVDVAVPPGTPHVDLFAEGPTPEWALPVPVPVAGAPAGMQRFVFDLTGQPDGASTERPPLKLTAVADDRAIEVVAPPD
jgi:DsbC/DsbD-like thiol-disulfide interchange protein